MDTNLSKLQDIVEDRGTWYAAVHGVAKSGHSNSVTTTTKREYMGYINLAQFFLA